MSGIVPLGYQMCNGKVEKAEKEVEIVRLIFNEYINGKSMVQISQKIADLGVRNLKNNGNLTHGTIGKILENDDYIGNNGYQPIVEKDIFQMTKLLRENKNKQYNRNNNLFANGKESTHYLSNILICGECGKEFRRYIKHHDVNKNCIWRCRNHVVSKKVQCRNRSIGEETIKQQFMELINKISKSPQIIETDFKIKNKSEKYMDEVLSAEILEKPEILKLVFKIAAERYQKSIAEDLYAETEKIKMQLFEVDINKFSESIFRKIIKQIIIHKDGVTEFELINGIKIKNN